MKKVLLLTGAMLALTAGLASAQGLNLFWNDCAAGGGAQDLSSPAVNCASNAGAPLKLVISIDPTGGGDILNVNGAQGIVDIQTDGTLPDWWHLESGGCRQGRLSAQTDIGSASAPFSCLEPWSQVGNQAGGANFAPDAINPNRGRITWIIAVPGEVAIAEGDGEEYLIGLNITKASTTTCAGCLIPACLVANEARLTKPAQTPGGDLFVYSPAAGQHVTYQGGGTIQCPAATPNQSSTWGQLKTLYR